METGNRFGSNSARCARSFSPTRSWRTTASTSSRRLILLLAAFLAIGSNAGAASFEPAPTRDRRILKRWKIDDQPRGVAIVGGLIYAGLAKAQSIIAIDPEKGVIVKERVLDHEEIASTKEIVTLRPTADGKRLVAANGSDESVSILTVPDLGVVREILLEGEVVRDALPDPQGRYLFVLGRTVHVFDGEGESEIRSLEIEDPMAMAVSSDGKLLAVIGSEKFESGPATVAALYELSTLKEIVREPLQTDRVIRAALFAAGDRSLVVLADDWFAEKELVQRVAPKMAQSDGKMRIRFDFRDLMSSEAICLATGAGPQIAVGGTNAAVVHFAERRCNASGTVTAAPRKVETASLYAVPAYALALDRGRNALVATDPAGYLTIYRSPEPPIRR
jgi:hypothetical protein